MDNTMPEAPALRGHAIKPNKAQGTLWGAHRDAQGNRLLLPQLLETVYWRQGRAGEGSEP